MQIVQCPFCEKKYDVEGVEGGSLFYCIRCKAWLKVPQEKEPPSSRVDLRKLIPLLLLLPLLWLSISLARGLFVEETLSEGEKMLVVEKSSSRKNPLLKDISGRIELWEDRARTVRAKLFEEFGDIFYISYCRPYMLAVERHTHLKPQLFEQYHRLLEGFYKRFMGDFKKPLGLEDVNDVLLIVILKSRESFDTYLRKNSYKVYPDLNSIYEHKKRRVVAYHGIKLPYQDILHEATHQLMHYFMKSQEPVNPFWFEEGLAIYYENFERDRLGMIIPGSQKASRWRLKILRKAIDGADYLKLQRFVSLSQKKFWQWYRDAQGTKYIAKKVNLYYVQSWALVYFLKDHPQKSYKEGFFAFFKKFLQGGGDYKDFISCFEALPQLEEKFIRFIKSTD